MVGWGKLWHYTIRGYVIAYFSPGSNGQNRPFSAEGPMAKQIIGRDSIVYKEAGTVLKFDKYLISHVIVTCAF